MFGLFTSHDQVHANNCLLYISALSHVIYMLAGPDVGVEIS